jgi:hypothetical protein
MTPRVLKVLRNFQLDGVFHMGQDWFHLNQLCHAVPVFTASQIVVSAVTAISILPLLAAPRPRFDLRH